MKWRQVSGLEAVKYARDRTPVEIPGPPNYYAEEEVVFFTDGSALRVSVDTSGLFSGSPETPSDPATVRIEIGTP